MKIIILTTENHIYANYILKKILYTFLPNEEYLIVESTALMPKKTKIQALVKYIKISGMLYVLSQIVKQYFVKLLWVYGKITKNTNIESSLSSWKNFKNCPKIIKIKNISSTDTKKHLINFKPDLIVSIFFNQIIPKEILTIPTMDTINIHPSFLPEYKGVSPTFWVLAENKEDTGITIHQIDEKIDNGDIIDQKKIKINKKESEHSLYVKCSIQGAQILAKAIESYKNKSTEKKQQIGDGEYRSFPKKQAVKKFKQNNKKFFNFHELLTNFNKIQQ